MDAQRPSSRTRAVLALGLGLIVSSPLRAQEARPPAAFLPKDSAVVIELSGGAEFIAALERVPLDPPWAPPPAGRAPWRRDYERLEGFLGAPLPEVLARLSDRGAALGLVPSGADWQACLVLWASDAERSRSELERLLNEVARRYGVPKLFEQPSERRGEAELWAIGEELWVARQGPRILASGSRALLLEGLERLSDPGALGLLAEPGPSRARALPAPDRGLWMWLDPKRLRGARTDIDWNGLDGLLTKPEGLLSLGAGLACLPRATDWALSAEAEDGALRVAFGGFGLDALPPGLLPSSPTSPREFLRHPENLGQALLHRDWPTATRERGRLFEPGALAQFSAKLEELQIFFGGLRLGEDVLARLSPWWQVALRPVPFPAGTAPGLPLPGAVLFLEVPDDPRLAHALEAAFQTLISLSNVESAQQGRPPLRLAAKLAGQRSYSVATPMPLAEGEVGDLRYNLAPALCLTDGGLLLASHEALLLDVLDELEKAAPLAAPAEVLELSGAELADWAEAQVSGLELLARLRGQSQPLGPWIEWLQSLWLEARVDYGPDAIRFAARLEQRR
jgi:hypothetical protein